MLLVYQIPQPQSKFIDMEVANKPDNLPHKHFLQPGNDTWFVGIGSRNGVSCHLKQDDVLLGEEHGADQQVHAVYILSQSFSETNHKSLQAASVPVLF